MILGIDYALLRINRFMWLAFIIFAVLIFYGSVFPFNFHLVPINGDLFTAFFESWQVRSSPTDMFGNVALFVPLGGVGMLAFPRLSSWSKVVLVGVSGFSVAVISQFAQYYVPARFPALQDVLWNIIGLAIGLGLGALAAKLLHRGQHRKDFSAADPTPLFLIGLWLSVRLFPFLPTTDVQSYKNSLKPLLLDPALEVPQLLIGVAGWLAVALLLIDLGISRRVALILVALGSATLALEIVIVANSVGLTDIVALLAALFILLTILRWVPNPAAVAAVMLVTTLVYAGLEPFQQSGKIGHFNWVPFSSMLSGQLFFSAKIFIVKLFFYAALVWFLDRMRSGSSLYAIIGATAIVAGIEIAQLYFTSHTSEITDPILVLLCAAIIYAGRSGRAHGGAYRAKWRARAIVD